MSVDPASAGAGAAVSAAAVEALVQAEINALAADAQLLQQQVKTGQVVTATVLPSNGLTDLISILGSRVAASLPPSLQPGETFTAQVTGFNGPQILLQLLATVEPPDVGGGPPPGLSSDAPVATTVTTSEPPPTALQAAATRPVLPDGVTPSIAPPPAVFVAASVRPAAPPPPGAPLPPPPSAQAVQAPVTALADIEARLAAARTGQVVINVPTGPAFSAPPPASPVGLASSPVPPLPQPQTGAPLPAGAQPPAAQPGQVPPSLPGRFALPPTITPSARFNGPAPATPAASQAPAEPAPTGIAAYRDPLPLVRALGLPATPTNIAAAKLALETPQRLPAALATLESALPDVNDPRVATLRTLTAFIGKIDPQSPQLAAQLSSFVDNVVTGNEPKMVQLLTAQLAADQPVAPPVTDAQGQVIADPSGATLAPEPTLPAIALAQLAERGAALGVDLKTQLLSIINAPPNGVEAADLVPAASTALTAVTAIQLNAAQAMNAAPQTMSFTIPMWLGNGYGQANVAIDRDAPEQSGAKALDGDNFHIAFVLTTKNLGTVSVDLQTVGRAFSLAVRTENESAAKRFGENLSRLTGRLETLRYQVKSAEAGVAPRGVAAKTAAPVVAADAVEGVPSDVNVRA